MKISIDMACQTVCIDEVSGYFIDFCLDNTQHCSVDTNNNCVLIDISNPENALFALQCLPGSFEIPG